MIQKFVDRFNAGRDTLRAKFAEKHPDSYKDIVQAVFEVISDPNDYPTPNPKTIHEIDDGGYQGTLLFVVPADAYQPDDYWYVKVYYGSCSGCDTLQGISGYSDAPPDEQQINDYLTLALHIVQNIRSMQDDAT